MVNDEWSARGVTKVELCHEQVRVPNNKRVYHTIQNNALFIGKQPTHSPACDEYSVRKQMRMHFGFSCIDIYADEQRW